MKEEVEGAWYIYRLRFSAVGPFFFALTCYAEDDKLLTTSGKVVVFRRRGAAKKVLQKFASAKHKRLPLSSSEPVLSCDFPKIIDRILEGKHDQRSELLNGLNTLLEIIDSLPIEMPRKYRRALHRLANFLTFNNSMTEYWSKNMRSKDIVRDALFWSLGAMSFSLVEP